MAFSNYYGKTIIAEACVVLPNGGWMAIIIMTKQWVCVISRMALWRTVHSYASMLCMRNCTLLCKHAVYEELYTPMQACCVWRTVHSLCKHAVYEELYTPMQACCVWRTVHSYASMLCMAVSHDVPRESSEEEQEDQPASQLHCRPPAHLRSEHLLKRSHKVPDPQRFLGRGGGEGRRGGGERGEGRGGEGEGGRYERLVYRLHITLATTVGRRLSNNHDTKNFGG